MQKYSPEYLQSKGLTNEYLESVRQWLVQFINNAREPVLSVQFKHIEQLEAMLPVLVKYKFTVNKSEIKIFL